MHPILAIRAFFAALFGGRLPEEILPEALLARNAPEQLDSGSPDPRPAAPPEKSGRSADKDAAPPEAQGPAPEDAAIRTLSILQTEGRLIDFLWEEIESFDDADIGAAVREIHRNCRKAIADHFDLEHVDASEEEALVTVPEGYDPGVTRLVGQVVGKGPYSGTLKHQGWRVKAVRLPKIPPGKGAKVIAPAEVEV